MTKDADFVELLEQHGPPPQVVLVTCGKHVERAPAPLGSDRLAGNPGDARSVGRSSWSSAINSIACPDSVRCSASGCG
jgi:hypothetical protein